MSSNIPLALALKPAGEKTCKLCSGRAPVVGTVDFNRHCSTDGVAAFPASGLRIPYNRCCACGFIFCAAFDNWTHAQFLQHIYNSDYILADPDFTERRPQANITWLRHLFEGSRNHSIVDYGGGNGLLAELARQDGFARVETYDPFTPEYATFPTGTFDVVTCFETLEHVPDPLRTIRELCTLAGTTGIILFSTLYQPDDIDRQGLDWWYVAPRNGHISLFSAVNLQTSFNKFGFRVAFFDHNKLLAFSTIPPFARHLFTDIPGGIDSLEAT